MGSSRPITALAGLNTGLFIDGVWGPSASGRTFDVENPATGETVAQVADGNAVDARTSPRMPR